MEEGEEITYRRNSEAAKERRRNTTRTPTAVVSEVFSFLNEAPLANTNDDNNELIMSDSEVDRLFSDLDIDVEDFDEADSRDSVADSLLSRGSCQEKFLAEYQSKDSGFASLERQKSEPGASLYDSFFENDDDIEDVIESPLSNDVGTGICDSFYDDVELCTVPRSISMEAKSTCVDNETEDAIVSSAEKFCKEICELSSGTAFPDNESQNKHHEVDVGQCHVASKSTINIVMVKKPICDHDFLNIKAHHSSADCPQIDVNSNISKDNSNKADSSSASASCDKIMPSPVTKENDGHVFDFVIKAGKDNSIPSLVQSDISYDGSAREVALDDVSEYNEQEDGAAFSLLYDANKKPHRISDDGYCGQGISITSVSSDDEDDNNEDEVIVDSNYPADSGDQAYDMIEFEPRGSSQSTEGVSGIGEGLARPENCSSEVVSGEKDTESTGQATAVIIEKSQKNIQRRAKLEKNPAAEMASDDSSDEDVGIYAESFRRSHWVRLSQEGKLKLKAAESLRSSLPSPVILTPRIIGSSSTDSTDGGAPFSPAADEVFSELSASHARLLHKRSDSMSTTASETEFKCQYVSRRKCLIQRNDSQQEYHRLSSRVYDQDKQVVIQRVSSSEELGLHLLDSHPAFITAVDHGSAAEKAGITEGQILVSVNDQNVLTASHADIVELIQHLKGDIKLGVANSDFQPARDLQMAVMSGYLHKLGNSAFKIWKKRYFILRQDNCLYYYKNEQETDPLGALPLCGYTVSRHTETSKDFCFKAEKYGGRTYYFIADNRDQMTTWVGALTEAAARSKRRKESFLSVSSHNVGLPALHILNPECAGFLGKLSPSKHTWRRRYCVLKDACVYYYKDKNSLSALGVAHLHGYTVDVENYQRRKFSFTLHPPEKKMRVFCFSADSEIDKKRWVESLIHSIQRWVRVEKEVEC